MKKNLFPKWGKNENTSGTLWTLALWKVSEAKCENALGKLTLWACLVITLGFEKRLG